MSKQNRGLGKGIDALFPSESLTQVLFQPSSADVVQHVRVIHISPNPQQPRREFGSESLAELMASIKEHGIMQPLVVTKNTDGFQLVAGERRWRAAKELGLQTVPVLVREASELQKLELALVENIQRSQLSPLDTAVSIARLHSEFSIAYEDIAKRLGKAYTTVINTQRLLKLPVAAQKALVAGQISEGHARAILALEGSPTNQGKLLKQILQKKLSVREAERTVQKLNTNTSSKRASKSHQPNTHAQKLSQAFDAPVVIKTKKSGELLLSVQFKNQAALDKFAAKF